MRIRVEDGVEYTYRFRLEPDAGQKEMLARTFGCSRFIYNIMLEDKIRFYEEHRGMLRNTPAQYKDQYPFLREVDSLALANAQLDLESAFRNFFRDPGRFGFPSFKKRRSRQSYTTNNQNGTVRIENHRIRLPKVGMVRVRDHRPVDGEFKKVTVVKEPNGRYYVSILVERDMGPMPLAEGKVGIDMGLNDLMTLSDGKVQKIQGH